MCDGKKAVLSPKLTLYGVNSRARRSYSSKCSSVPLRQEQISSRHRARPGPADSGGGGGTAAVAPSPLLGGAAA